VAVTEHNQDDHAAERTRWKVQELMIAAGIVMGDAGINGCSRGSWIRCFHYARERCPDFKVAKRDDRGITRAVVINMRLAAIAIGSNLWRFCNAC